MVKWKPLKASFRIRQVHPGILTPITGLNSFGTTTQPALEAVDMLNEAGISIEAMRIKAFPFQQEVLGFY